MTIKRLFVFLFALALFAMAVRETLDPDMWWHLRTGEVILQDGIPRQDIFSFTVPHHDWITHEWLSQVVMWVGYQAGGLPGLIILFALLVAFTFWLVYLSCEGRPFWAAFLVLGAAITSAIVWGVRPQIFNLCLTAVFLFIIERYRRDQRAARLVWVLPPLTILWANLHSGYLLGIVLIGTYAVGEGLQRWLRPTEADTLSWREVGQLAAVTVVSFLAAVLNPSGPDLWIYPFFTLGSSAMQAYIQEWHSPNFHLRYFWPFAGMIGLGVLSWVYSHKRPTWSEMLLFLGTAAAGLISARNIPIFAIVATPIIARHWLIAFAGTAVYPALQGQEPEAPVPPLLAGLHWLLLVGSVLGVIGWTAQTIGQNEAEIARRYPVTAVDFLQESGLAEARGYNSYNWGGYLIWRGLPVFVDGRADVYGDDFLFYYRQTFEVQEDWQEPLQAFDVDYVLMEQNSPLSVTLLASDAWEEVYTDGLARVFVPVAR